MKMNMMMMMMMIIIIIINQNNAINNEFKNMFYNFFPLTQ